MGGGPTKKRQGPRAEAVDIVDAVATMPAEIPDLEPGAAGLEENYCQRTHQASFRGTGPVPQMGTPVQVRLGRPLRLLSGELEVGLFDEEFTEPLTRCLELGYVFGGYVESYDPKVRRGIAVIARLRADE